MKHESEAEQLAAEHHETLAVLAAWSQADADVADGLRAAGFDQGGSPLEAVAAELRGIRERLTVLDDTLGPLLARQARAYEEAQRVRPL